MTDTTLSELESKQPQTIYLKNYQPPVFFTEHVDLTFDLHEGKTTVTNVMAVQRNPKVEKSQHNELCLNGEALNLVSVRVNGQEVKPAEYVLSETMLKLKDLPDTATIEIINEIVPEKNTALMGLYRSNNTYCTQCEAEGFRRITYYQDRPDVLATFTTKIIADKKTHPMLLSNGNLVESGELADDRHWVKWEDPFKKPCYLFALVAGDFDLVTDKFTTQSGREIDLRIYVDKGFADQTAHAMYSLQRAMAWDEQAYGREYDLDIYMIVAIGDFVMGAMENKGLNIFNTKYVLAKPETATDTDYVNIHSVIGHEYFHNWTGNRVTCRDWFQLSLKEGLTIFRDQSFSGDELSKAVMRIKDVAYLREGQFPEDAGPLAHPVRPESYIEINNFYTATVYNKGAEVLRMMQTILGKDKFRQGMDLYFERHDGDAVTIEDFVAAMEAVSQQDLQQFRRWYRQAGTPRVNVVADYDPANKRYTLEFTQFTPATPGQDVKEPFHIPIVIGLLDKDGRELHAETLHLREESQLFTFDNIDVEPVPSLFRHFSAPVKVNFAYSDDDLIFLAEHDTDPFNRWEAVQRYLTKLMLDLVQQAKQDRDLTLPDKCIALFTYLLTEKTDDLFLLAELLSLPSENYIGEQMDVFDVDGIHKAREFVLKTLAEKLHEQFHALYLKLQPQAAGSEFTAQAIGARQLRNCCLNYLALVPKYVSLVKTQFDDHYKNNMTNTAPALVALANLDVPEREAALAAFYEAWQNEPLVVDKWLSIQATSKLEGTLAAVKALMNHPAFDLKNPNKVYALIAAFCFRSHTSLHDRNGEGYAFIREVVQELDVVNPQVAGRIVRALTNWRRFDEERQALMREQLTILAQQDLSSDLYELVNKSL